MAVTVANDLIEDAKRDLAGRILSAAIYVANTHQQRLGVSFYQGAKGQASKPGEYPRKRTGQGQANVLHAPDTVEGVIAAGLIARIGARKVSLVKELPHLIFLEKERQRLGFKQTAADTKEQVRLILGTPST